jgi:hypothetical protein
MSDTNFLGRGRKYQLFLKKKKGFFNETVKIIKPLSNFISYGWMEVAWNHIQWQALKLVMLTL